MKFDFNTIENFDDHIEKSIPNYNILIDFIKSISQYFYVENTNIYDLGEKYTQKTERLGRAVPPLLMKEIAEHIYKTILL